MTSPLGAVALERLTSADLVAVYESPPLPKTIGPVHSCRACGIIVWMPQQDMAKRARVCAVCGAPHLLKLIKERCYFAEWVDVVKLVAREDDVRAFKRGESVQRRGDAVNRWRAWHGLPLIRGNGRGQG